jgi:cell surface protein SprA
MGYKIKDLQLFRGSVNRKIKSAQGKKKGQNQDDADGKNSSSSSSKSSSKGINQDLNLRLDISFRNQASITRDIASGVSNASSGNRAIKISFMADYTLSRLLTLTAYYDQQTNTPLLASSSYPTTTRDFGLSLKFSLTR